MVFLRLFIYYAQYMAKKRFSRLFLRFMRIQLYFVGFPLFFGLSAFFSLFIGFSVRFRPFSPSCKLFSEKPFISRLFASTVENFGSFCFFRRFPLPDAYFALFC